MKKIVSRALIAVMLMGTITAFSGTKMRILGYFTSSVVVLGLTALTASTGYAVYKNPELRENMKDNVLDIKNSALRMGTTTGNCMRYTLKEWTQENQDPTFEFSET